MEIKRFVLSEFSMNSYLLIKEKEAILIDVGFQPNSIIKYLSEHEIVLKAILLTHTHLDHIGGVEEIRDKFPAPVYVHSNENDWLSNPIFNGSEAFPFFGQVVCKNADKIITDDKLTSIGNFNIEIITTPGHTPGGISYYIKPWVFTGDTLFNRSIGRTDLYGGSEKQLLEIIKAKLFVLPEDTIILPGHGDQSTIGDEKRSNPFVL